jgi:hypothetical protein
MHSRMGCRSPTPRGSLLRGGARIPYPDTPINCSDSLRLTLLRMLEDESFFHVLGFCSSRFLFLILVSLCVLPPQMIRTSLLYRYPTLPFRVLLVASGHSDEILLRSARSRAGDNLGRVDNAAPRPGSFSLDLGLGFAVNTGVFPWFRWVFA